MPAVILSIISYIRKIRSPIILVLELGFEKFSVKTGNM